MKPVILPIVLSLGVVSVLLLTRVKKEEKKPPVTTKFDPKLALLERMNTVNAQVTAEPMKQDVTQIDQLALDLAAAGMGPEADVMKHLAESVKRQQDAEDTLRAEFRRVFDASDRDPNGADLAKMRALGARLDSAGLHAEAAVIIERARLIDTARRGAAPLARSEAQKAQAVATRNFALLRAFSTLNAEALSDLRKIDVKMFEDTVEDLNLYGFSKEAKILAEHASKARLLKELDAYYALASQNPDAVSTKDMYAFADALEQAGLKTEALALRARAKEMDRNQGQGNQ